MIKIKDFNKFFDHTILKADATYEQIDQVCMQAIEYDFYAVCVNSVHLNRVCKKLEGSNVLPICVVGFPLGASDTSVKEYETKCAIDNGAKEIDMVINVGAFLSNDVTFVTKDIRKVIQTANNIPVKVIIETCYLSPNQICEITKIAALEGAAFIKTSTGFGPSGASIEDIINIRQTLDNLGLHNTVKIKASGGIKTLDFCLALIEQGAARIGSSSSVQIYKEYQSKVLQS